jgi:hypothetical protein
MEQLMTGEAMEVYSERSENDTPTMVKIATHLESIIKDGTENLVVSVSSYK